MLMTRKRKKAIRLSQQLLIQTRTQILGSQASLIPSPAHPNPRILVQPLLIALRLERRARYPDLCLNLRRIYKASSIVLFHLFPTRYLEGFNVESRLRSSRRPDSFDH